MTGQRAQELTVRAEGFAEAMTGRGELAGQRRRAWASCVSLRGWWRWRGWIRSGVFGNGPAFVKPQDEIWPYCGEF